MPDPARPPAAAARLLIFTRYPRAGEVKTRLIPAVGPEGAAAVQRELAERTLAFARLLRARAGCELEVRVTGAEPAAFEPLYGNDLRYAPQGEGELGERLAAAFDAAFAAGCLRVAAIGTDCPAATDAHLARAFERLAEAPGVLGPATDGGYWLLGLTRACPELFAGIAWGSERVADETRARAAAAGLELAELERLDDVDRPEDLERWLGGQPRTSLP